MNTYLYDGELPVVIESDLSSANAFATVHEDLSLPLPRISLRLSQQAYGDVASPSQPHLCRVASNSQQLPLSMRLGKLDNSRDARASRVWGAVSSVAALAVSGRRNSLTWLSRRSPASAEEPDTALRMD